MYEVNAVPKRRTSFRDGKFRDAIANAGGTSLTSVLNDRCFLEFQRLLGALRNSVHSTGLRGVGVSRSGQPQSSVVRVFEDAQAIWDASNALGSRSDFGVTEADGVVIEPYTFVVRFSELGLRYVNKIAEATDVARMLPPSHAVSDLLNEPPHDGVFAADIRRRVDALG